jgi:5-methylcytosine-specific restriction endonuclease McrA
MAREFAKKFYNSKQWQTVRQAYRVSKFGICERCKCPNATDVHHKVELNEFNINNPEVAIDFKNLELLCKPCHSLETNSKYSPLEQGYSFNADGDLIYSPPIKNQDL